MTIKSIKHTKEKRVLIPSREEAGQETTDIRQGLTYKKCPHIKWQRGLSDLAMTSAKRQAEKTLKIEIDDEAFARQYLLMATSAGD